MDPKTCLIEQAALLDQRKTSVLRPPNCANRDNPIPDIHIPNRANAYSRSETNSSVRQTHSIFRLTRDAIRHSDNPIRANDNLIRQNDNDSSELSPMEGVSHTSG
ncbi:hypothetical protein [Roseobacter sp. OBYS 0001]|uniref:hypothetical protein n=1 Tax=Roseobacter sp. OBYS 0001 TaxID=882651 RepID=UPI001C7FBE3A|nr:hypothetical protein [Roseobacter sp. OBYS 0001]